MELLRTVPQRLNLQNKISQGNYSLLFISLHSPGNKMAKISEKQRGKTKTVKYEERETRSLR